MAKTNNLFPLRYTENGKWTSGTFRVRVVFDGVCSCSRVDMPNVHCHLEEEIVDELI